MVQYSQLVGRIVRLLGVVVSVAASCKGSYWYLWFFSGTSDYSQISKKLVVAKSIWKGTRWRSWLTHCATSRKVAGSIPGGVIGIFCLNNPSGRTMALGSTQPLTSDTRNIYWGVKGGRFVGLTDLLPSCADCLQIWEPEPGTLRTCNEIDLPF